MNRLKNIFFAAFGLFCAAFVNVAWGQAFLSYATDGKIYIKTKAGVTADFRFTNNRFLGDSTTVKSIFTQYGVTGCMKPFEEFSNLNPKLSAIYEVSFTDTTHVLAFISALQALNSIDYAELMPIFEYSYDPNDPGYTQAALNYHHRKIDSRRAWDITRGSGATIAILDSGFDVNHEDLAGARVLASSGNWGSWSSLAPNIQLGQLSPDYDFSRKAQFVNANSFWHHGTHVAAIAAGNANNKKGIAGVAFESNLMLLRISGDTFVTPRINVTGAYLAIAYAAQHGANVINCSWHSTRVPDSLVTIPGYNTGLAVIQTIPSNCILVAAASNYNADQLFYPAAYRINEPDKVIAVAASDVSDKKWVSSPISPISGSNYNQWVDIIAPGANIYSAITYDRYAHFSGTSMATPVVAGICALLKAAKPTFSNQALKACLLGSTDNIYSRNTAYVGKLGTGRANAFRALQCATAGVTPNPYSFDYENTNACAHNTFQCYATTNAASLPANNTYSWSVSPTTGVTVTSATTATPTITITTEGNYTITLVVNGIQNQAITKQVQVVLPKIRFRQPNSASVCTGSEQSVEIEYVNLFDYITGKTTPVVSHIVKNQANTVIAGNTSLQAITELNKTFTMSSVSFTSNGQTCVLPNQTIAFTPICCDNNLIDNGDFCDLINYNFTSDLRKSNHIHTGTLCNTCAANYYEIVPAGTTDGRGTNVWITPMRNKGSFLGTNGYANIDDHYYDDTLSHIFNPVDSRKVGHWKRGITNLQIGQRYSFEFLYANAYGNTNGKIAGFLTGAVKFSNGVEIVDSFNTDFAYPQKVPNDSFAVGRKFSMTFTAVTSSVDLSINQIKYFGVNDFDFGFDDITLRKIQPNCSSIPSTTTTGQPVYVCGTGAIPIGLTYTLPTNPAPISYTWRNNSGTVLAITTSNTLSYTLPVGTNQATIIVQAKYSCATSTFQQFLINRVQALPVNISTIMPLCNTISLQVTGGSSYAWNNGSTSQLISVQSGTYTVTASGVGCTTATKSITISLGNTISTLTATTTATNGIQQGQSATLSATATTSANGGAISYLWSTGATAANITVTPTVSTIYTVTATNANGCSSSSTVLVRVCSVAASIALAVPPNNPPCQNRLTASSNNTTAGAIITYQWNTGATGAILLPTNNTTRIYTVTATLNNSGCIATATASLLVEEILPPIPTITGNASLCPNQTTTLTATGASTYNWNTSPVTIGANLTITPLTTTTYTVTATSINGCTATASRIVTVTPTPTITGTTTVTLLSSTTLTATAAGATAYVWSTGATTANLTITPTTPTTVYTVTVTTAAGCTASTTVTVTITCNQSSSAGGIITTSNNNWDGTNAPPLGFINAHYVVDAGVTLNINFQNPVVFDRCRFLMRAGSKIVVNGSKSITAQDCRFFPCAGGSWLGIEIAPTNIAFIALRDTIEGANIGIDMQSTQSLTVTNSLIRQNQTGIKIASPTATATTPSSVQSFICSGNQFIGQTTLSGANTTIGDVGILVTNVSNASIGGGATIPNRNVFEFLRRGIEAVSSNVIVNNALFRNINYYGIPNTNNAFTGYGIYAHSPSTTNQVEMYGISTSTVNPSFSTIAESAIYADHYNLIVQRCYMNNVKRGIETLNCLGGGLQVGDYGTTGQGNNIQATSNGILCNQNSGIIIIDGNNIGVSSTTAVGARNGIEINESAGTASTTSKILNNTIALGANARNGIIITGKVSTAQGQNQIKNNIVNINSPTTNQAGIAFVNCSYLKADCNHINNTTGDRTAKSSLTALTPIALLSTNTTNALYSCTETINTYTGVKLEGTSTGTTLQGTQFNNHSRGLWANSATLNNTLPLHEHKGNVWNNNTAVYPAGSSFNAAWYGTNTTSSVLNLPVFKYDPATVAPNPVTALLNPSNKQPSIWFTQIAPLSKSSLLL